MPRSFVHLKGSVLCWFLACAVAGAETSGDVYSLQDVARLERIAQTAPGFAGITRVSTARACLQLGSVFPGLTLQTLDATRASGLFPDVAWCPDLESVPYSLRTLARVATQIQGSLPDLQVGVDTGLNRVIVQDKGAVLARLPALSPYVVDRREQPAYQLTLDVTAGVPWVRIRNLERRRIAAQPFCGAAQVDVWQGPTRLTTGLEVACALTEHPSILRAGEVLTLRGEPSTPLASLPAGSYVLRVTTDDHTGHHAELTWTVK